MIVSGFVKDQNGNLISGAKVKAYKRNTHELLAEAISESNSEPEMVLGKYYLHIYYFGDIDIIAKIPDSFGIRNDLIRKLTITE